MSLALSVSESGIASFDGFSTTCREQTSHDHAWGIYNGWKLTAPYLMGVLNLQNFISNLSLLELLTFRSPAWGIVKMIYGSTVGRWKTSTYSQISSGTHFDTILALISKNSSIGYLHRWYTFSYRSSDPGVSIYIYLTVFPGNIHQWRINRSMLWFSISV